MGESEKLAPYFPSRADKRKSIKLKTSRYENTSHRCNGIYCTTLVTGPFGTRAPGNMLRKGQKKV